MSRWDFSPTLKYLKCDIRVSTDGHNFESGILYLPLFQTNLNISQPSSETLHHANGRIDSL